MTFDSSTASVIAGLLVLVALMINTVASFLTRRQDRKDLWEKEEREEARRDREKRERDEEERQTKAEIIARAQEIADRLAAQVKIKELQDALAHAETLVKIAEAHHTALVAVATAASGVVKAEKAFDSANNFNLKLAEQQKILAGVLTTSTTTPSTNEAAEAAVPAGTVVEGTFTGVAHPKEEK